MSTVAIIPARYASTRFPGKPLVDLCGQTMLERVWRATCKATTLDAVAVATDDRRIKLECDRIKAECILTPRDVASGTDRVAIAQRMHFPDADIILNVQGDEPLLQPELLDDLVNALKNSDADVATPVKRITDEEELDNPTIVKVTQRTDGTVLYFSRSVIPHVRGARPEARLKLMTFWKHIGIYAYRRPALERFVSLPQSDLENAELLEQLRLLANGARFLCVETHHDLVAIDAPEDAARVREILNG